MALKVYRWRGHTWQFEEGNQPEDAEPLARGASPEKATARAGRKQAGTANKAGAARDKKA